MLENLDFRAESHLNTCAERIWKPFNNSCQKAMDTLDNAAVLNELTQRGNLGYSGQWLGDAVICDEHVGTNQ